ncbi:acyltransferase [Gallibacter sp. Marseille-QA0791]|uniref:acyltransferase n=1 Tax=Gallibacter sp. Marseille-QA0791 TaxID=3378781 RepID=UPI003D0F191D
MCTKEENVGTNCIIGNPKLINSKIEFASTANNNILYCEDGVKIKDSKIVFQGDNSLIYFSKGKRPLYFAGIVMQHNNVLYTGEELAITGRCRILLYEGKHLIIGNDCLFATDVYFRNADPHLIYDVNTKKRMNESKSIFVGDHVWMGQQTFILKGSKIGSGAIVAGKAVVAGKEIFSNSCWGGNPAKHISQGIFWLKDTVHKFKEKESEESMKYKGDDEFIYQFKKEEAFDYENFEKELNKIEDVRGRLKYIEENIAGKREKNRFFI